MGLLDILSNLSEEKRFALMGAAANMLGGAPGQRKNFGADLGHGLMGGLQAYQGARVAKSREEEEKQQRDMRAMQMEEMKRAAGARQAMTDAAQRNMIPGAPQMMPTDQETPSGPAGPGSFNMQGYANDLMKAGPEGIEKGLGLLSAIRAQNAPIKVGKDDRLLRPNTFEQIVGPAPGDEWEDLPRDVKTGQYMQRNKRTGQLKAVGSMPPQVNVSNNMPPPEKTILKVDEDRLGELSSAATSARRFAQTSQIINKALKGAGGGGMVKLGTETAKFLGFNSNTISASDLAESLNTRLATEVRAPGSGSTSNLEFEAYRAAAPSLRNSEEGRELMTEVSKKVAERNAKLADYGRSLIRSGKFSDEEIAKYDDRLGPLFGPEMMKKIQAAAGQQTVNGERVRKYNPATGKID